MGKFLIWGVDVVEIKEENGNLKLVFCIGLDTSGAAAGLKSSLTGFESLKRFETINCEG